MAKSYLIDTSAVIKYLNSSFSDAGLALIDQIIDNEIYISFITEIELQVWNPPNEQDIAVYQAFIKQINILNIESSVIAETIRIRKIHHLKLPDAIIAATASANNLILIADNDKDFLKVVEIEYLNPGKIL